MKNKLNKTQSEAAVLLEAGIGRFVDDMPVWSKDDFEKLMTRFPNLGKEEVMQVIMFLQDKKILRYVGKSDIYLICHEHLIESSLTGETKNSVLKFVLEKIEENLT